MTKIVFVFIGNEDIFEPEYKPTTRSPFISHVRTLRPKTISTTPKTSTVQTKLPFVEGLMTTVKTAPLDGEFINGRELPNSILIKVFLTFILKY